ncbi:hypothetical protein AC579_879 [Pseudocercospora musae]|uniref:protein-tyrosine-phosphatase n=1 Tax=Pseudocercospora musae TaxID=113226 RepID=A0A139GYJ7_9PEZI|nr:hypothetical protein AC579_879 [Pseudocercospora musae]
MGNGQWAMGSGQWAKEMGAGRLRGRLREAQPQRWSCVVPQTPRITNNYHTHLLYGLSRRAYAHCTAFSRYVGLHGALVVCTLESGAGSVVQTVPPPPPPPSAKRPNNITTSTAQRPLSPTTSSSTCTLDLRCMALLDRVQADLDFYIGGLFTLRRRDALQDAGITHVLSVLKFKPDEKQFRPFTHKVVQVDDVDDENLLQHFEATNNFIQHGLDAGGGVLVHCFARLFAMHASLAHLQFEQTFAGLLYSVPAALPESGATRAARASKIFLLALCYQPLPTV